MTVSVDATLRRWAGAVALVALAFSQQPGYVVADTKLDLVLDPGSFLRASLSAWDAQAGFGQLQNQAYGYLFPMGPFFWAGQHLGVPGWAIQRSWWALLLVTAYVGFLLLAERLGIGGPGSQVVGGLAYALGPRVITVLGPISAEALPLALLPWILLPLVVGSTRGSPRRAAARSGLAVACAGGINAAATLAVLVVPLVWLATRQAGPRRRSLSSWWALCVGLAVAWWALPLLVLGRYAFPFLDNIESARTTTQVTSVSNVLRGADHWVGYLVREGEPIWRAGWTTSTAWYAVGATSAVALLGLWGLSSRSTPQRTFLATSLLAGLLCVGLGYTGAGGSPLGPLVQDLLDGPLAPFRNVHKFDPVLRLPLTLGVVAALARLSVLARRWADAVPGRDGVWLREHPRFAPGLAFVLAAAVLLGAAVPAWTGALPNEGAFKAVPAWWTDATSWLAARSGRTLLEPASGFGDYAWGRPWDEPIQALARAPWAVRGAAPLGAPGLTRYLDSLEEEVTAGRPSAALAPALRRVGVTQILLRNDLAPKASATPALVARATLQHSPGIHYLRGFGPDVTLQPAGQQVQALEVYGVDSDGRDPRVVLLPDEEVGFTGGPEAVTRAGDDDRPWIAPDEVTDRRTAVVTDTFTKHQLNVGGPVTANTSEVLDAQATSMGGRPLRDIDPYEGAAVPQTVVALESGVVATVTSSETDPYLPTYRGPVGGPYAPLDGALATAWVASPDDTSPTWTLTFPSAREVPGLALVFSQLPTDVARPAALVVTTDTERREVAVSADTVRIPLGAHTAQVRVRLERSAGERRPVGVSEISLEGQTLRPSVVVPAAPESSLTRWSFETQRVSRPACVRATSTWTCSAAVAEPGSEPAVLDRTFTSSTATRLPVSALVTPLPGPSLNALLDRAYDRVVDGSSQEYPDAAARPGAAFDGDPDTAWIPDPSDGTPRLSVTLGRPATVRGISVVTRAGVEVVGAVIRDGHGAVRTVALHGGSVAGIDPISSRRFDVTLRLRQGSAPSAMANLAVSEVRLLGLPDPTDPQVVLGCGGGPDVIVDAVTVRTSLRARVSDLVGGSSLPVRPCGAVPGIGAGQHRVRVEPTDAFAVTSLTLGAVPSTRAGPRGSVEVLTWGSNARSLDLGAAPTDRLLVMNEGANAGWRAQLGAHELAPVQVDGWRQAWRVPADAGGRLELVFVPNTAHRLGLGIGALLVLVLIGLALVRDDHASGEPPPVRARDLSRSTWWVSTLAAGVALAGPAGLAAWGLAGLVVRGRRGWWAMLGLAWLLLAVTGPFAGWRPGHLVLVAQQVLALVLLLSAVLTATLVQAAGSRDGPTPGTAARRPATRPLRRAPSRGA